MTFFWFFKNYLFWIHKIIAMQKDWKNIINIAYLFPLNILGDIWQTDVLISLGYIKNKITFYDL